MGIIGILLHNISCKKEDNIKGSITVTNSTDITDVREGELPSLEKKGLFIDFDYITNYKNEQADIAKISIHGSVICLEKNNKEIIDKWKNDRMLPDELHIAATNAILRKCSSMALWLSEEVQLPSPIALPMIAKKKE